MDRRRRLLLCVLALAAAACGAPAASPVQDGSEETRAAAATPAPAAPATPQPTTPAPAASATLQQAPPTTPDPAISAFDSPPPAAAEPDPLEPSEPFGLAVLELVPPEGDAVRVPVYVAADPQTRGRGLMLREELHPEAGMVFLFPGERRGGFFMKDTLIPLSILFYGPDGEVRAILDMEPCEADPCTIYDPEVGYQGAIEVNQGWFAELGVDDAWTVALPEGLPAPS